ncbi:hypothetical protein NLM33_41380 [Bradyrhizobium sp. CCGUVB1N3]|uniref:hypothetical protein n=1 Tax=Bradyrhizobium sp. CCGUVB1N3 TaxID=2949629 RepID=UPI0020B2E6D6|nr:hypothetical protein [Bradyrhizobium sp. CCGUVB1N3]MCP3476633.1 hypothetical protein [Bradyrhizobium sp. CCGUVB1N3]
MDRHHAGAQPPDVRSGGAATPEAEQEIQTHLVKAVRVVVSSAKQALAKADELAESGNDIQIKDLAGRIIDTATIIELAAHE